MLFTEITNFPIPTITPMGGQTIQPIIAFTIRIVWNGEIKSLIEGRAGKRGFFSLRE